MATQTFSEAKDDSEEMIIMKPDGTEVSGFYCDPRLDRFTMPSGWYAYDIRTDDDGCGIFVELCHNYVLVNSGGTFFTQTRIPELDETGSYVEFLIDEEDWVHCHDDDSEPLVQDEPEKLFGYSFC